MAFDPVLQNQALIRDITAWCDRHRVSKTRFGLDALNDRAFVFNLEKGRQPSPRTLHKVREHLSTCPEPEKEAT